VTEFVDAVVVGARCAGSATAVALARAGRQVIAVDKARFPSDTLSTHLLFAGGVAELAAVGALDRVEALGAPRLSRAAMFGAGHQVHADYTPVGKIDYGLCVRRTGLDAALVDTARDAGVDVREGTGVTELLWQDARVVGVRVRDRDGTLRDVRASLVVGADGRRSTVARQVGADAPRRQRANQRACLFGYWLDTAADWRSVAAQWREGVELGTAFPCDDGLLLVLVMPPVERVEQARGDLAGEYQRSIDRLPGLRDRLRGCTLDGKVRVGTDTSSYFRRSAGKGWALAGDAGHFKDPVTAQGIRDAVRFGRLLGETVAPVLDDPRATDRALAVWERRRDRECLPTYKWTNGLARAREMTAFERLLYRAGQASPEFARQSLDVFSRTLLPREALFSRQALRAVWAAVRGHTIRR